MATKVVVASANPVKVEAVAETLHHYPFLQPHLVHSVAVPSGVSEQPMTLQETIDGARHRAFGAFFEMPCHYSFGIESGIMQAEAGNELQHYDICVCAVYDGQQWGQGLSCAFALPPMVSAMLQGHGLSLEQAMRRSGLSAQARLGQGEGAIGVLTGGRLSRKEYTKQAVMMALVPFEQAEHYRK